MNIFKVFNSRKYIVLTVTVVILFLSLTMLFFTQQRNKSHLQQIAEDSTFLLYEPTYLPNGYKLNDDSISLTTQALLMTASKSSDKTIILTQQPVPAQFDFESFYDKQFDGAQDVSSIYGRGKAGILNGTMSGSLVTDSTWIIITGPEDLPANDMKLIIERLKLVK